MTRERDCSQNDGVQGAFDGERPTQDVAGHLVDCNPCGGSLKLIQVQGDALNYLSAGAEDPAIQPVVQRILTASAKAGREQLADLLYELAKACLVLNEVGELRTYRGKEPRKLEALQSDFGHLQRRSFVTVPRLLEGPQGLSRDPSRAVLSAYDCVLVLENVEGPSPRQQLIMAHTSNLIGKHDDAIAICSELLEASINDGLRSYAFMNLMCAQNRIGLFKEASEVGKAAMRECPSDFMIAYNYAVALAYLDRADEFRSVASDTQRMLPDRHAWKQAMVCADLEELTTALSWSEEQVLKAFGFDSRVIGLT